MLVRLLMLWIGLATIVFSGRAEAQPNAYEDIFVALKSGNADALMNYVDGNVRLTIEGTGAVSKGVLSKVDAVRKMDEFFTFAKPYRFNFRHEGQANEWLKYKIGYLLTAKGKYRTMMRVRESGGRHIIQELEFIRE